MMTLDRPNNRLDDILSLNIEEFQQQYAHLPLEARHIELINAVKLTESAIAKIDSRCRYWMGGILESIWREKKSVGENADEWIKANIGDKSYEAQRGWRIFYNYIEDRLGGASIFEKNPNIGYSAFNHNNLGQKSLINSGVHEAARAYILTGQPFDQKEANLLIKLYKGADPESQSAILSMCYEGKLPSEDEAIALIDKFRPSLALSTDDNSDDDVENDNSSDDDDDDEELNQPQVSPDRQSHSITSSQSTKSKGARSSNTEDFVTIQIPSATLARIKERTQEVGISISSKIEQTINELVDTISAKDTEIAALKAQLNQSATVAETVEVEVSTFKPQIVQTTFTGFDPIGEVIAEPKEDTKTLSLQWIENATAQEIFQKVKDLGLLSKLESRGQEDYCRQEVLPGYLYAVETGAIKYGEKIHWHSLRYAWEMLKEENEEKEYIATLAPQWIESATSDEIFKAIDFLSLLTREEARKVGSHFCRKDILPGYLHALETGLIEYGDRLHWSDLLKLLKESEGAVA